MSIFNFFTPPLALPVFLGFIVLAIWSIVWKGMALWQASRRSDKWWFIIMLVINTAGILEIIYIYIFSKKKSL